MRSGILFFIFLFYTTTFAEVSVPLAITIADTEDIDKAFEEYHAENKVIDTIEYSSDASLSKEEFYYLTDLSQGVLLTKEQLKKAALYLFAKKKFKQITIHIFPSYNGCHVTFDMVAYWTLSKVKVTGVLFGKERYASLYSSSINSGEVFEHIKHTHAVSMLVDLLKNEGYLEAKIDSFYTYNRKNKTISVRLEIAKGERFSIKETGITISTDERERDTTSLKHALKNMFMKKIVGSPYQKNKLEKITAHMAAYLEQEGYAQSSISMKEKISYKTKKVSLDYNFFVGGYRQFIFFGNAFFSKKKLLDHIMELGRSAWLVPASMLAQEIVQAYKDKGFLYCAVDVQEEYNKCIFLIKEGKRATVNSLEIKNANAYTSDFLVKNFFTQTKNKPYFDNETFQDERNNLCNFYIKNGYLDIHIVDHTFIDSSDKKKTVLLSIEEGARYTIESITIKDPQSVVDVTPIHHEALYLSNDFVIQQREELQNQYKEKTNEEYVARSEIKKITDNSVAIEWTLSVINTAKQFGKIVIIGTIDAPFNNIMQEQKSFINQQWNSNNLRLAFMRFKTLNVFDTIFFSSKKLGMSKDVKEEDFIALTLQHDDTYEIRLRTGFELKNASYKRTFGQNIGYKVGGTFVMKNPFKRCDLFQCDINFSRFYYEISAEYRYPWILNVPVRGLIKTYLTKHDQPAFIGSNHSLYTAYNNGILCGLHKSVGFFDWSITAGFDWSKIIIKDDLHDKKESFFDIAQAINFKPSLLNTFIPYFFIESALYVDCLDDKMYPRKGLMTVFSIKNMFPLSYKKKPSYLIKLLLEQSFFWPLKKVVAAIRIRFGHIFHKNFSSVMPTQRFYLGGSQSLRGYDRDMAPPLGLYTGTGKSPHFVPRGSKSMVNINMELRIPLPKKWGVVLFQDIGTLGDDLAAHVNLSNILATTGFGVRYETPVGPLRFDIGWKWFGRSKVEKTVGWYLTIGNAF